MDELVRRLREIAECDGYVASVAEPVRQAADTLTRLAAALEGMVAAVVDMDGEGSIESSDAMQAARAALREVGRG